VDKWRRACDQDVTSVVGNRSVVTLTDQFGAKTGVDPVHTDSRRSEEGNQSSGFIFAAVGGLQKSLEFLAELAVARRCGGRGKFTLVYLTSHLLTGLSRWATRAPVTLSEAALLSSPKSLAAHGHQPGV
jgi:hypothetical protein